MRIRLGLKRLAEPWYRNNPRMRQLLRTIDSRYELLRHGGAEYFPSLIQPDPRVIAVAITAACNQRCDGCRYGRDFMTGSRLPWPLLRDLVDDVASSGLERMRIYGGEPLLHPDLARIVSRCQEKGIEPLLNTNGVLLGPRVDDLYSRGLREIACGLYGVGARYDQYTGRSGNFDKLERTLDHIRRTFGEDFKITLSWLLMRPTCSVEALNDAFAFVRRYGAQMSVHLVHYSLPYFTNGTDGALQFTAEDRPVIEQISRELIRLNRAHPGTIVIPERALRSIPDWLILQDRMRVPCNASRMIWVSADGAVQLCYVAFPLGNLHEQRLTEMLFSDTHRKACQDAFALRCPNCHCGYPGRIEQHPASRARYS